MTIRTGSLDLFVQFTIDGIGAGEMNRTPDLRITNALLYQLSYTGFGDTMAVFKTRHRIWLRK